MKEEKIKRCVIYARFSSSGQREESIEGQLRECREYARRKNYIIVSEYADRALSGTSDKRPSFQRMIRDSQKGAFDVVICWKHDRFARNRYDAALYKARLKQEGVMLEYAMETVPEGPEGIILDSVMEGYAEYYSANLSQNVKRGYYESALKRQTLGYKLLGYKKGPDGRYAINEDEAPIVKRIYTEYAGGRAAFDIIHDLNEEGFRTRAGREFTKNSVRQIIQNEKYKGVYQYADIYDEEGIPPIVTKEVWEKANRMKDLHHEAPALKQVEGGFLLSGKLFCGECGEKMTAGSGTSHSGKVYKYYVCNGRRKKKCHMENVEKEYLEDVVVQTLVEIVHSDEVINLFVDRFMEWQEKQVSPIPALEKRLAEIDSAIKNLMKAIEQNPDIKSFADRIRELEAEKIDVETDIGKNLVEEPKLTRDAVVWFLERFRSGDVDDASWRIYLVNTFLQAVYLFGDGRLVLQLNYSGENNKIGLNILKDPAKYGDVICSNLARLTAAYVAKLNIEVIWLQAVLLALVNVRKIRKSRPH